MENQFEMEAIHGTEVRLRDGIAQIRKCSFKPEEHFINLEIDGQKKPRYYLTVDWRLFWLQLWCQENGKEYNVEEQPVVPIPGTAWIQTVCTVVIDGKIAGQGIGGINLNGPKGGDYAIQSCATIAKGRALANAGFGSVFTSASESESGGIEIPCDSGVAADFFVVQPQRIDSAYGNPIQASMTPQPQNPAAAPATAVFSEQSMQESQTFPAYPARQTTQTPVSLEYPKTREEALAFPVPIRGSWYGKPLSEVIAKDPGSVRYYAEKSRNGDLKQAARLILNMI